MVVHGDISFTQQLVRKLLFEIGDAVRNKYWDIIHAEDDWHGVVVGKGDFDKSFTYVDWIRGRDGAEYHKCAIFTSDLYLAPNPKPIEEWL